MKRTSFFLPEPLLKELADVARKQGTPMAELLRQALQMWLRVQSATSKAHKDE